MVAGGSGVTPMMSMIRTRLADRADHGRIVLLYSSRSEEEIIFAEELRRLEKDNPDRLAVTHLLTSRDGRLDVDAVSRWVTGRSPGRGAHYYLCGPEPLMDAVRAALAGLGSRMRWCTTNATPARPALWLMPGLRRAAAAILVHRRQLW